MDDLVIKKLERLNFALMAYEAKEQLLEMIEKIDAEIMAERAAQFTYTGQRFVAKNHYIVVFTSAA